jgi:transposase
VREPRFQPINRNQFLLRPVEVEKLVGPDHRVRAIWEMAGALDLSAYTVEVKAVEGVAGRPAYDPRLLVSLWIYAYSQAIASAREVERRCAYDPAFQWLTGMEAVNHHSLSDFRVDHAQALDKLFAQVLAALSEAGLIGLEGVVVHDGTKVAAAASGKSFHREETLRAHLAAAEQRLQEMGDPRQEGRSRTEAAQERARREQVERAKGALAELKKVQAAASGNAEPGERRASQTDPEARIMKESNGGYGPCHNVQISSDPAHGIILSGSVTQDCNDQHQMLPALAELERQTGQVPKTLVVDEGYTTRENVLAAAEWGVDLIGSGLTPNPQTVRRHLEKRGVDPAYYPEQFVYDPATDTYTCPQGRLLHLETIKRDRWGVERKVYKARAQDCRPCALRQLCKPGGAGRRIQRSENVPVLAAYVAKMQTAEAQALYRLRAPVAEFSNLWLKAKLGLWQFCVRGLQKVRCELLWACLAYNIRQWYRLRWKLRLNGVQA